MHETKYIALQLQMNGEKVQKDLIDFIIRSKLSDLCYAYKCRVKPEHKLIEKVTLKVKSKSNYNISSITDVVGIRFVTLFRTDMIDLVDQLLPIITNYNHISENPFRKQEPEEIKFFSPHIYDEITAHLNDKVSKHLENRSMTVEHSKEGYSSLHIVTRLNTQVDDILPKENYFLPVEIQIRTVFEDAWGEIDHRYGYVTRTGKDSGKPINNPEYVLSHLKALKKFTDACSEYADVIHQEATATIKETIGGKIISVDADDCIISRLTDLGVDQQIIDAYLEIRNKKEKAQNALDAGDDEGVSLLLNTAEKFKELADEIEDFEETDAGNRLAYFYIRMNEAVCLLLIDSKDEAYSALQVYSKLETEYTDFPLLKMRIGQAIGRLGDLDKSIEKLNEAKSLMDSLGNLCDGPWPDSVPEVDYKHIAQLLPRVLGYQYWKQALKNGISIKEKESLLKRAYIETLLSVSCGKASGDSLIKTHNNLVYYAVSYKNNIPEGDADPDFVAKIESELPEYIKLIEDDFKLEKCTDLELLDTLMDTNVFLGHNEKVGPIANRILSLSLGDGVASYGFKQALKTELAQKAYQWLTNNTG